MPRTQPSARRQPAPPESTSQAQSAAPVPEINDSPGQDTGGASPYLLDRLLYKGILPRYAFPTDVATFYVFDIERSTRYTPAFRYTPSQGLNIALSQYAPGKEVWINNKLFVSQAIYSPIADEMKSAWTNRRLYYECSICHYAKTIPYKDGSKNDVLDCPACRETAKFGPARTWMRPPGFAHPVTEKERTSGDEPAERSFATRAKLMANSESDSSKWVTVTPKIRHYHLKEHLLVTNRGPREEGYHFCTSCGLIEPAVLKESTVQKPHPKPTPSEREPTCSASYVAKNVVLGTDFITDVLLISISVESPYSLRPELLGTQVALRTVSEALAKAACQLLELEPQEIQAEFRPALSQSGNRGVEAEVYLYDTLPGGAGFTRQAGELGFALFERALRILESCPDDCDRSCYRCLRSFKNKFEHDRLDRHLGASLLKHGMFNAPMSLPQSRRERSLKMLAIDLLRAEHSGLTVATGVEVAVADLGTVLAPILVELGEEQVIVDLAQPLSVATPVTADVQSVQEFSSLPVVVVDELWIRRNLPSATRKVFDAIGISE